MMDELTYGIPKVLALDVGDIGQIVVIALVALSTIIGAAMSKSKQKKEEAEARSRAGGAPSGEARSGGGVTLTTETTGRDSVQQRLKELAAKRRAELERRAAQRRTGGVEAGPVLTGGGSAVDQRQELARRRAEEARHRREVEQAAARQRAERERAERERIARQRREEELRRSERGAGTPGRRGAAPKVPPLRPAGSRSSGGVTSGAATLDERHLTVMEPGMGTKRAADAKLSEPAGLAAIAALLHHRDGVRNAIVLGELLGPPVALRDEQRPII